MIHTITLPSRVIGIGAGILLSCSAIASANAQDVCGLCNTVVVTNSELATCFLSDYDKLAAKGGTAIVVDLSGCDTSSRGIAEALPSPLTPSTPTALEPDVQFMVSRAQLECLKLKLEAPGLVLDPFARIELTSCG